MPGPVPDIRVSINIPAGGIFFGGKICRFMTKDAR